MLVGGEGGGLELYKQDYQLKSNITGYGGSVWESGKLHKISPSRQGARWSRENRYNS